MRVTGRGPAPSCAGVTAAVVLLLAFVSGAAGAAAVATNGTISSYLSRVDSVLTAAARANELAWW